MINEEFDLSGLKVCIAIPCYRGVVPVETAIALAQVTYKAKDIGVKVDLLYERETALVQMMRDRIVHKYLTQSTAEYLFWLDDDIIFNVEDFFNNLSLCSKLNIVAGAYPARSDNVTFFIRNPSSEEEFERNEYGFLKSNGTGLGFCVMKREIVQQISDLKPEYENKGDVLKSVFDCKVREGRFWGEDMLFFDDLWNLGYPVWVNPFCSLKHSGRKDYDARLVDVINKEEV